MNQEWFIKNKIKIIENESTNGRGKSTVDHIGHHRAEKIFNEVNLGFNPAVIDVLNNLDSTENEIEMLKVKISEDILVRLFSIANSVYFGQLKRGNVETFYEVVTRLGMDFTRVIIIFLSIGALSDEQEVKLIFAKSFATSILADKLLANECGLTYTDAKKLALGGLLLDIGRIIIAVYKSLYKDEYENAGITEDFIDEYHPILGVKFMDKFEFPDYLKNMLSAKYLTLNTKLMDLSGIVITAYSIVDWSFRRFHNKLVIASPMPDREGNVAYTTGAIIEGMFKAVGLSRHIEIINQPLPNQLK